MMTKVVGLINMESPNYLKEFNAKRPIGSEPFAGKFRMMDFTLSCMVNAGIDTVGLMLPFHSRSVLDHVRSAKEWNLARKQHGLFYLPIDEEDMITRPRNGDISLYYKNLRFVEFAKSRYLLIASCDVVHHADFKEMLYFHQKHNADVTLAYKKMDEDSTGTGHILDIGEEDTVIGMKPVKDVKKGDRMYMRAVLIDSSIFVSMIRRANAGRDADYFADVVIRNLGSLRVVGYEYGGYAARINSVPNYFKANMDMLKMDNWRSIFGEENKIHTKIKDAPPAKYMQEAKVGNSLVSNGCVVEGTVENSVLARGVRIGRNAVVRNSIIMQNTVIADDAVLEYVICDKDQSVQPKAVLRGSLKKPLCLVKHEIR